MEKKNLKEEIEEKFWEYSWYLSNLLEIDELVKYVEEKIEQAKKEEKDHLTLHIICPDVTQELLKLIEATIERVKKEERKKIEIYLENQIQVPSSADTFTRKCEKEASNGTITEALYFISKL